MSKLSGAWCCAVAALVVGSFAIFAIGQDDPFGDSEAQSDEIEAVLGGGEPAAELGIKPAGEMTLLAGPDAPATQDFCRCVGDTHAPSVVNIHEALRSPLKEPVDFTEEPLASAIGQLSEVYGIPIKLDPAHIEEAGISLEEPITVSLDGISLRAALQLMLKTVNLTYIIDDEVLLITTPEEAEEHLRICVYDVRDFKELTRDGGLQKLVETIVSCVATESWAANGEGEAEIRPLEPGLLVVSQTQAVHEEVRDLLETIRHMCAQPMDGAAAASK